jgi:phosphonate transport system substrate-binding protein
MKLLRAHARLFSLVAATGWIRLRLLAAVLCAASAIAVAQPGTPVDTQNRELRHARLYAIATSKTFNHVNRNNARAALKVWFDVVGQQRGFVLDSKVDIVDSVTEIRERLESHSVELVVMGITDYLELESSRLVVPVLTDSRNAQGGALYAYLLLVNPSSGTTTIASLRGKNILVSSRGGHNTGMAWLDVLLGKEQLGRAVSFFASIKAPDEAQACILPLFFGTVDACVVDEINLNVAKEMNPQLGQLRVLARSRPMIESVIATPTELHPFQKELIDAMLSLHEDPRGRQLLMVFKTDRLVRIQPGDLEPARELWTAYARLPGSPPHRPAGSGPAPAAESNPADRGKERN